MVAVSKHVFEKTCGDADCYVLLHPWNESCWKSTWHTYRNSLIGSAKFYFIIYMVQNLMRGKKVLKKKELMQIGEYYVRSTLYAALVCGSSITLGCLLRWLMGNRFKYDTYMYIPNVLNAFLVLLEPPRRRGLVINLFSSLLMEYCLRKLEGSGYLSLTITNQSLIFMAGSALLFYLMRLEGDKETRTPLLWLYTAEKVRHTTDKTKNVCPHDGLCWKYILKGSASNFGLGLAISLARTMLTNIKSPIKALSSVRGSHFKLALFFGSYIGIYRAVICYLCAKRGFDSATHALPAGFLAGLSFVFKPSLGIATASVTGALKLCSTILYEKNILPDTQVLPVLLYGLCQGILFRARFLDIENCPNYVVKAINTVGNGCAQQMHINLLSIVRKVT